jgi:hypothetical protein
MTTTEPTVPKFFREALRLTTWATWSPALIDAFWAWACASADPAVHNFVRATHRMNAAAWGIKDTAGRRRVWNKYCCQEVTPHVLLLGLEALYEQGVADRATISRMQDGYLRHVDRAGHWRYVAGD